MPLATTRDRRAILQKYGPEPEILGKRPVCPRFIRLPKRDTVEDAMISVAQFTEIRLSHRASYVAVAAAGHVAAISRTGMGSILAPDRTSLGTFQVPSEIDDLAISADGGLVAVAARGRFELISSKALRAVHHLDESLESCLFGAAGEIWSVARWDEDSVALEIRQPGTWEPVARTELADPFGDSCFKFHTHPDPEYAVIWAAGGQDGQCIFWAHRSDSEIEVTRFPDLESTTLPSFSPSGEEFLVIADSNELRSYRFPHGPLLRRMAWPFDELDNQIGDLVVFADARRALVPSTADRLYLVDLPNMAIADELGIRGHEPRPVFEAYPGLRDPGLCSDLAHVVLLPSGQILSVHKQIPVRTKEEGADSLLIWDLP